MSRILFIFDLDGTLVDSAGDLTTAVNLTRAEFGLGPISVETVAGYVGDGVRLLMARALRELPGVDLDRAVAAQKAHYLAHLCEKTRPYPGVEAGLARLQTQGHALAVATNKPVELTETLLTALGLRPRFDAVLGGGSVPDLKPHPAMLEAIMARLGFGRSDTWMVGDNWTDLESARRAGVRAALMRYGMGDPGLESPDLEFGAFGDFTACFEMAQGK